MIQDIKDIKKIRKRLGLSQKQLAKIASVSQSMIAKVEKGLIDPSFSSAQRIIFALEVSNSKHITKAKEVMKTPIHYISSLDSTKKAVNKMRKLHISQLPVKEKGIIVGTLTEKNLLNTFSSDNIKIANIMDEAPPFVNKETPINVIISLLKHFQLVLVSEKGRTVGLITKSDIIGVI